MFLTPIITDDFMTIMTGSERPFMDSIKPVIYNMIYVIVGVLAEPCTSYVFMALGELRTMFVSSYCESGIAEGSS